MTALGRVRAVGSGPSVSAALASGYGFTGDVLAADDSHHRASGALALAVFASVIVWNVQHDWASFTFQGARRLATSDRRFEFPQLLLYVLIVVTPWAVAGLASSLARSRREMRAPATSASPTG